MNSTPEALPMPPPSLPQTVMSSPAVHPAEIAAEKDNAPLEVEVESTPSVEPVEVEPESVEVESVEVEPVESESVEVDLNTFIFDVSTNIQTFINVNNEKLNTLNTVVEQLSNLGLSDNSAIDTLNNQRAKYMQVLDAIRTSFVNVSNITDFIL